MENDPFERVTAALADAGDRLGEYTEVWREAIRRNAADDYRADDFMVDLQTLWGMSVRDTVRVSTALLETLAPLVPRDDVVDHSGDAKDDGPAPGDAAHGADGA
jgi:hypothetical protein